MQEPRDQPFHREGWEHVNIKRRWPMRVEDCFGRFVELVESVVQRFGEARAGFRQLERTRQALEQLDAEEVLQCLDLAADCALGDVEFRSGSAERHMTGRHLERA
jgi:hypothetical protein